MIHTYIHKTHIHTHKTTLNNTRHTQYLPVLDSQCDVAVLSPSPPFTTTTVVTITITITIRSINSLGQTSFRLPPSPPLPNSSPHHPRSPNKHVIDLLSPSLSPLTPTHPTRPAISHNSVRSQTHTPPPDLAFPNAHCLHQALLA
ncbi:hypothetical protein BU24DRAFT_56797 [Aaosphaeria arxii CBS 175.79]|uniref:Uncharacterized protein n=1 Tax=Aaosphaeria arxii CBS 175.79 TaxID=1450172 RepID=A0A6A5XBA7_9PLEO|nr:uncharacterized protein BU24DRAFT_56797 [Aaosphaeria arxii CBS 175.79]KAF2010355.1 hypothetical protein BU24DRAFT_56797 [Aaosphaeria arxii CBS 175.79]